jgi:hypothetical protein
VNGMDPEQLAALDDHQLAQLAGDALAEQRRRALESGDVDTLADAAFATAFDPSGVARNPTISGRLLLCPGSLTGSNKSGGSHDCVFIYATAADSDGAWVFEHPDRLTDLIRHTTVRGRDTQQSITVLPATEGLKVQRIVSKARSGKHERQSIVAWQIRGGVLVTAHPDPVSTTNSR